MKNFDISGFYQSKNTNMMRVILYASIMLALILPVSAAGSISFTSPTPDNDAILNTSYANINTTITDPAGSTGLINWDNSLLGWWRMNEAAGGTSVQDFSGNGKNGNWYGSTTSNVTTGKFGNALEFDGIDDYVSVNNVGVNGLPAGTMSVWFKTNNTTQTSLFGRYIISLPNNAVAEDNGWDITINAAATGLVAHARISGLYINVPYTMTIADDNWHNAVSVYDGTNLLLYVDGVNVGSTARTGTFEAAENKLYLGEFGAGYSVYFFNGSVDETQLWNRALSPQEISASYDAGAGIYNNFTNLANGNYTYQAYAQNPSGDVSQTGVRTLTIQALTLESYNNSAHTNIDNFFTAGESTVYMFGTGFTPGTGYKVAFYDGGDNITKDVANNADSSGNLNANYSFKPGSDEPGTWHAQVIYATGSASGTYSYNGPGVLIEDSFVVDNSAIPEFPAGMAIPLAASLVVFAYLRNRINNGKK